jgi:DNA-binding transcriptional LysR family regulator
MAIEWDPRIARRLKLRELQILSNVVQEGSMAKAAMQLMMSQPTVSEAIANLEAALGVRLLDRSPKGVEPTIYAQALLKRGQVVFDELQQGLRDLAFLANPTVGEVRVGCPENLCAGFVPGIIERLSPKHPRVSVHVVTAQTAAMEFRELRDRSVDLMLGRIFDLSEPFAEDDINAEVIGQEKYFVVAGAQSPWAQRRKIALAELVDEQWLLHVPNNRPAIFYASIFEAKGLKSPWQKVITFSLHVNIHLLATGNYLSILPASVLHFNAEAWSLKALPVDLGVAPRPMAVFTLKNRTLSPVVEIFIEHARAVAKSISTPLRAVHRGVPTALGRRNARQSSRLSPK